MPNSDQLQLLEGLADERCDAALRTLAAGRTALAAARAQLELLERYGEDYHMRLGHEVAGGMQSDMLRNYRGFMSSVAQAIGQQKVEVTRREESCAVAEKAWREAQRQVESYRTLGQREQMRLRGLEERRRQKDEDEHAARMEPFGLRTSI